MGMLLRSTRQRLWQAWMAVQVEFQGQYSADRLQQLESYISGVSTTRLVLLCLLTPLPCLALSLLKEVPPLEPTEAGAAANWVFFIRAVLVMATINGTLLIQMGQGALSLKLTACQVISIAMSASAVSVAVVFALCSTIVFPLPFGVLVSAPPDVLIMAVCLSRIFGPRIRADPSIWSDLKKQLAVIHCEVSLTFIYPVYIYGVVSLTGMDQLLFVAILPIIKLIAKNWISRALADQDDIKPQSVIFIVEVFNALYVSNALQSASSWTLTAAVMAVDLAHFWLSMFDVLNILNEVTALMARIPQDHPFAKENFLLIATRILAVDGTRQRGTDSALVEKFTSSISSTNSNANLKALDGPREPTPVRSTQQVRVQRNNYIDETRKLFHGATVLPAEAARIESCSTAEFTAERMDIKSIFSNADRARFIEKSTHVLFITEYIVLVEYVEVVLPVVYSVYRMVLFNMPNKVYYASLATLSADELWASTLNVLAYSSFEFVSFILSIIVLKRTLGFSSLRQLAFVLERHAGLVQVALVDIVIYVTQLSLVHLGADFSFKFAWLQSSS